MLNAYLKSLFSSSSKKILSEFKTIKIQQQKNSKIKEERNQNNDLNNNSTKSLVVNEYFEIGQSMIIGIFKFIHTHFLI